MITAVGKTLMFFNADEGWQSYLLGNLPDSFALTLAGEPTAGSIIEFRSIHSVVDPDKLRSVSDPSKPGEYAAAFLAKPPNLYVWCAELQRRDYLDMIGELEQVQSAVGGASGMQFEVSVTQGKGTLRDEPGLVSSGIPIFPSIVRRALPNYFPEGYRHLIIDLEVAGEEITVIVTSQYSEFEEFRERARDILSTVKWLDQGHLED
jgi:hypothetical protein